MTFRRPKAVQAPAARRPRSARPRPALAEVRRACCQTLERRALLTTITGTSGNDIYRVFHSATGSNVLVYVNAMPTPAYVLPVDSNPLIFNALGGDDSMTVDYAYGSPVNGGLTWNAGTAGANGDSLYVDAANYNTINADADSVDVIIASVDDITYSGVERITLDGDLGDDTITLDATAADVLILGGGDKDTITLGGGDLDTNLTGNVSVIGGSGDDSLVFDDSTDSGADGYTFSQNLDTATLAKTSTSAAYRYTWVESVSLIANESANAINVNAIGYRVDGSPDPSAAVPIELSVRCGGGNDVVTVGNGSLDPIVGNVRVNGGASTDTIVVDDAADTGNDAYTLNNATFAKVGSNYAVFAIIGIGSFTVEAITVNANTGNNAIAVNSSGLGTFLVDLTVNAGSGNDTITLGNGDIDGTLLGTVSVAGGSGTDSLTIDDADDGGADAYTFSANGTGTTTLVKSSAPYAYSFNSVENAGLFANGANNAVNVDGLGGRVSLLGGLIDLPVNLYVFGGAGNDTVTVGGGDLDGIVGNVEVTGDSGTDAIVLSDAADTGDDAYTVNSVTLLRSGWSYVASVYKIGGITIDVEAFTVNANVGNNAIAVTGLGFGNQSVNLTVNAGNGNDAVTIASNGGVLSNLLGNVTISGGAGVDTVTFNDASDTGADSYTLGPTTLTKAGLSDVFTYQQDEAVTIRANNDANAILVSNTSANVPVTIQGNGGVDSLTVNGTGPGGQVSFDSGAGDDNVTLGTTGVFAGVVLIEAQPTLGAVTIGSAGLLASTLSTLLGQYQTTAVRSLSITGQGVFNIRDGALVVDYLQSNPAVPNTVRSYLASGYAGGTWSGVGISSVEASIVPTRGIGYGTSAELLGPSGGTFAGVPVDGSAVLVRYTLYGDTDLNRAVGFNDLLALAQSYNGTGKLWINGDSDFDGDVDFTDLLRLAQNYNALFALDAVSPIGRGTPSARFGRDKFGLLDGDLLV